MNYLLKKSYLQIFLGVLIVESTRSFTDFNSRKTRFRHIHR
jgi:hypothetical protein